MTEGQYNTLRCLAIALSACVGVTMVIVALKALLS